jgi:hypothetical protein
MQIFILRNLTLFSICFFFFSAQAQHRALSLGFGISNLYDLNEGSILLKSKSATTPYSVADIDLQGLNGSNTKLDLGYGVIAELTLNKNQSLLVSYTNGTMTAQQGNQYSSTKLNLINGSFRHYLMPEKLQRQYLKPAKDYDGFYVRPFAEIGVGLTNYNAGRYFLKDQGLFSKTSGNTISNSVSLGCLFHVNSKIKFTAAPNFIINYSDAVDGYKNNGTDIMMSSTIGVLFSL